MSMVGYVLGLGDRLDKVLLCPISTLKEYHSEGCALWDTFTELLSSVHFTVFINLKLDKLTDLF